MTLAQNWPNTSISPRYNISPFNFEGKRALKPLGFEGGEKRLGLDKEWSFEENNLGVRTGGKLAY